MTTTRPAPQALTIVVAPGDLTGPRVTVNGDLDAFTVDHLTRWIVDRLGGAPPATIELDLSGVAFIDAAAAGWLRRLHGLAGAVCCTLSISAATPFAWWLFQAIGLTPIFPAPDRYRWASGHGS